MTWRELRDFLNSAPDNDRLDEEAILHLVDAGYEDIACGVITDEDEYYNADTEGTDLVSNYDTNDWDGRPLEDPYNTIIPAGKIYLLNTI